MTKLAPPLSQILAALSIALLVAFRSGAQEAKPARQDSAPAPTEKNAAQIELLETKVRFETNGDSRKEVHARVRINNELGARQFARLNFDFNRSFQSVEIPIVRITHVSGGTADILPSAITDKPDPAVVDFPAYHDVRVKSVRILGLAPGDQLEYRVISTTTQHPLAPDFWLDHTFDRSGVVSQEIFELDLPSFGARTQFNPDLPAAIEKSGEGASTRTSYKWKLAGDDSRQHPTKRDQPDVAVTTYSSWSRLASEIAKRQNTGFATTIYQEAEQRGGAGHERQSPRVLYDVVSRTIATVDLPFELSFSVRRGAEQILQSNYGTAEEKARLLSSLMTETASTATIVMLGALGFEKELPRPSLLLGTLLVVASGQSEKVVDPALEVAPFGAVPPEFRGRRALSIRERSADNDDCFTTIPAELPFPSKQTVEIQGEVTKEGSFKAKAHYTLRGDNELLLRVAFHKTEKEKWRDVAQMLALSDGFRGTLSNVTASDPYATKDPFTVEYEISQPKFVDWSKKTLHIPAILPLPSIPDPPTADQIKSGKPIDLGTPLTIDLEATIELPAGATAQAPIGTTVNREYASFSSKYSVESNQLHASRSYQFLASELPASRAADLVAFLHAVQSDQTQLFTVTPAPQR